MRSILSELYDTKPKNCEDLESHDADRNNRVTVISEDYIKGREILAKKKYPEKPLVGSEYFRIEDLIYHESHSRLYFQLIIGLIDQVPDQSCKLALGE